MLDFVLGFAVGIVVCLGLIVIDAKYGRSRRVAALTKARDQLMADTAAREREAGNPFPFGDDFIYRRRNSALSGKLEPESRQR